MGYFKAGIFTIGGQSVLISRTGWTGELGYEIYTLGQNTDYKRLWDELIHSGKKYGMVFSSMQAMNIRRIEAGILDSGSDFDASMAPGEAGLQRFVDKNKKYFIGHEAINKRNKDKRIHGVLTGSYIPKSGDLVNDGINKNPASVLKKRSTSINRGEAFWMRIGTEFNSYFGPFELVLQNIDGIEMGETRERYRIILKNNLNEPLNVTMTLIDSEDAPTGEDNIGKDIKVLVRGEPNEFDLSYGYTSMEKNKAISYALKSTGAIGAASSQQIILGVDRTNSTGNPGEKIGGILEFADSKSMMKIQVPISAIIPSNEGLWIGDVKIGSVRHDITFFRKKNESSFGRTAI